MAKKQTNDESVELADGLYYSMAGLRKRYKGLSYLDVTQLMKKHKVPNKMFGGMRYVKDAPVWQKEIDSRREALEKAQRKAQGRNPAEYTLSQRPELRQKTVNYITMISRVEAVIKRIDVLTVRIGKLEMEVANNNTLLREHWPSPEVQSQGNSFNQIRVANEVAIPFEAQEQ